MEIKGIIKKVLTIVFLVFGCLFSVEGDYSFFPVKDYKILEQISNGNYTESLTLEDGVLVKTRTVGNGAYEDASLNEIRYLGDGTLFITDMTRTVFKEKGLKRINVLKKVVKPDKTIEIIENSEKTLGIDNFDDDDF